MRTAIFALAALCACSDLPPYEPSCGNGVVEPHEDCDTGSGGCFACSLACSASGTCPDGLACGGDSLCHAPGGQFRPQGQVMPFVTGRPASGAFDATDGTNDVVLPTVRGLVAYTSALDVLSPYPFALDVSLPDLTKRARPWLEFTLDTTPVGLVTKIEDVDGGGSPIAGTARLAYASIDIGMGRPMFTTPVP